MTATPDTLDADAPARPLVPRRPLPGGRAVLGGFLVAASVVGVLAMSNRGAAAPTSRYVVARRTLVVGSTVAAADLSTAAVTLPTAATAARAFRDPRVLVGSVVVAPVATGELVQASAVAAKAPRSDREMSLRVDVAAAVDGRLRAGDRVDVAATFGSGADSYTAFVVRSAEVIARAQPGGPLGDRRQDVLTLALNTSEDALAVAHAVAAGQIAVVRSTGGSPATAEPYRAPASRQHRASEDTRGG